MRSFAREELELLYDVTEETAPSGAAIIDHERKGFWPEHDTSPPQTLSVFA
jgi:hypothetical protein